MAFYLISKRKILLLTLVISILIINISFILPTPSYAAEEMYFEEYEGTKWVGGVGINSGFRLLASDGSIAYCLNEGRSVPNGGYQSGYEISTNIKAILRYGYPNNEDYGGIKLSKDQAICATQLAIWEWDKTGKGDTLDLNTLFPMPEQEPHGSKVIEAAKWLSAKAESGYSVPEMPSFSKPEIVLPVDKSVKPFDDEFRRIGPYRMSTEIVPGFLDDSYWVDSSMMPEGTFVGDYLGINIESPHNAMDFYMYIPNSYFEENVSGSLKVKIGSEYSYSYEGETTWKAYEKPKTQNVVITASTKMENGSMSDSAEDEIHWTNVEVKKLESNEGEDVIAIKDTEFELFYDTTYENAEDQEWQSLGVKKTDDNGKLNFGGVGKGRYKLVEIKPNINYSLPSDDGKSDEKIFEITDVNSDELQVFSNDLLAISCEVDKDTILKTSAAFRHLTEDSNFDNTGVELFMYDIGYASTSNAYADEFTVDDYLEAVNEGKSRVAELWTGIYQGDYDGKMNVWYKTNLTDNETEYSEVSAMSSNPHNVNNPEKKAVYSNAGFKLWQQDISTDVRTHLSVKDLELDENEYITGLRFEHGRVEKGFTSLNSIELAPISYLVSCPEAMLPPENLKNSVTAKIARNVVLTDEKTDSVSTGVIEGFDVTPKPDAPFTPAEQTVAVTTSLSPATGDSSMSRKSLILLFALIVIALGIIVSILISNKSSKKRRANKKGRKAGIMNVALALIISLSVGAAAAESASAAERITEEYTYKQSEGKPSVPEKIERNGQIYSLLQVSNPTETNYSPSVKTFTYKINKEISVASYKDGGGKKDFPQYWDVNDGLYNGAIGLRKLNINPAYVSKERKVDKIEIIKDLKSNDVTHLPESKTFEVSSDSGLNAVIEKELKRTSVSFETVGVDKYGIPNLWNATLVFRGLESYLDISHYKAEAIYEGSIAENEKELSLIAIYHFGSAESGAQNYRAQIESYNEDPEHDVTAQTSERTTEDDEKQEDVEMLKLTSDAEIAKENEKSQVLALETKRASGANSIHENKAELTKNSNAKGKKVSSDFQSSLAVFDTVIMLIIVVFIIAIVLLIAMIIRSKKRKWPE